jgi:hypothetical protein
VYSGRYRDTPWRRRRRILPAAVQLVIKRSDMDDVLLGIVLQRLKRAPLEEQAADLLLAAFESEESLSARPGPWRSSSALASEPRCATSPAGRTGPRSRASRHGPCRVVFGARADAYAGRQAHRGMVRIRHRSDSRSVDVRRCRSWFRRLASAPAGWPVPRRRGRWRSRPRWPGRGRACRPARPGRWCRW